MPIQMTQWVLWLLLTISLYVALSLLVPSRLIKSYLPLGLVLGWVQAVIVVGIFQFILDWWRLIGDPVLFGFMTVFTPIAWIPPTIIFAAYFPRDRTWYKIAGFVLLFAAGAIVTQLFLQQLGMWQSIRWNPLLTGLLATATHLNITIYLLLTKTKIVHS